MREVREDRDVVRDSADAVEREAVRRRLQDGDAIAREHHGTQRPLDLRRLGRRGMDRVGLVETADPERRCARHPGWQPCCHQAGRQQAARARLAVRPCHADDGELQARIAVPPARGRAQGRAGVASTTSCGTPRAGSSPFDDDGRSTQGHGGPGMVMAVGVGAGDRDEDSPGADAPRVVRDASDPGVVQRVAGRPGDRPEPARRAQPIDQTAERACAAGLGRRDERRQSRRQVGFSHGPSSPARARLPRRRARPHIAGGARPARARR